MADRYLGNGLGGENEQIEARHGNEDLCRDNLRVPRIQQPRRLPRGGMKQQVERQRRQEQDCRQVQARIADQCHCEGQDIQKPVLTPVEQGQLLQRHDRIEQYVGIEPLGRDSDNCPARDPQHPDQRYRQSVLLPDDHARAILAYMVPDVMPPRGNPQAPFALRFVLRAASACPVSSGQGWSSAGTV